MIGSDAAANQGTNRFPTFSPDSRRGFFRRGFRSAAASLEKTKRGVPSKSSAGGKVPTLPPGLKIADQTQTLLPVRLRVSQVTGTRDRVLALRALT